jgi:peptidoglycan/LPS O-acetylase OafA/YrhL
MRSSGGRLRYLDGMRGLAITAVVLWHFFGPAEAKSLPYGDRYAQVPALSAGWMGVELFFLISGFVIFLTLEKCSGFWDFMIRRWL